MAVAAELTGVNPPMLRVYEEKGLITPHRTPEGHAATAPTTSREIHHISDLLAGGLNLAGVEAVLALERREPRLCAPRWSERRS